MPGPPSSEHGIHSSMMHPNYSPTGDTHSSLSPTSPPPPPQPTAPNTTDKDPTKEPDSGFTLMHPAFQRQTPKRSQEASNQSIYGQPNPSDGDQHKMHAAQDLTTSVNCNGVFVSHHMSGMSQEGRSTSLTPDDFQSRELDLTAHRPMKSDTDVTNNNTC